MADNQDQSSLGATGQASSGPTGMGARIPPPPRPPVGMPVMLPSPAPKKGLVSRIKDAMVLMIFFGSLLLNILLLVALVGQQGAGINVQESVILDGAKDQQIAVIDVNGIINDKLAGQLWPQFTLVRRNENYKALLLRVNSPGGGVGASDTIAHYVKQVKEAGKPVVVFMSSVAASGGYYVSAGADYIMAGPTTITGSIGVIAQLPNIHGTLQKIGANVVVIPATPATRKSAGSPFMPWDPANREYFQKIIDSAHERFVAVVYDGRQEQIPDISVLEKLADGAALTSAQAKDAKLIDEDNAYFEQAVDKAADLAGLAEPQVVRLSRPPSLREVLTGGQAENTLVNIDASFVDQLTTPRLLYLWQGQ